jgi:hypothetical protein
MYGQPKILPLDASGRIFTIQDEKGDTIGTGTRAVCEVLLYIITQANSTGVSGRTNAAGHSRANVRAAISM